MKNYKSVLVEISNIAMTITLWIYVLPKFLRLDSVPFKFLLDVLLSGSANSLETDFFSILLYIIYFLWMILIFSIITKKIFWSGEMLRGKENNI